MVVRATTGQAASLFLQILRSRCKTGFESRRDEGRRRTRHERPHPGASGVTKQIRTLNYSFALTGEGKATILASVDWPDSRTPCRKETESIASRRRRRVLPRAGAASDV